MKDKEIGDAPIGTILVPVGHTPMIKVTADSWQRMQTHSYQRYPDHIVMTAARTIWAEKGWVLI